MSTIKSSADHLTINADGASKDIKFQANGVQKASISSAGAFTSTTIDATALTGLVTDDTVDESSLKSDNAPTNDYVLTAKSTAAGGLTWAAVAGGVTNKLVVASRVISSTGTQAITGFGFQPSAVWAFAGSDTANTHCISLFDSSKNGSSFANRAHATAGTWQANSYTQAGIILMTGDNIYAHAEITSYDTDGFTLTWSDKNGVASVTATLVFLGIK